VEPSLPITPPTGDILRLGVKLTAPTPEPKKYHNDLIHPCVRYIPQGIGGHQWWMVGTPYYNRDFHIENPILFYGDSRPGGLPPLKYTAVRILEDSDPSGYNSDPCLYFDGSKLWIFWRENNTKSCLANNVYRATFGVYTTDGKIFSKKKMYATELSKDQDSEVCPIVMKIGDQIKLFGCHHSFSPKRVPFGLSIWNLENNNLESGVFRKDLDVLPSYKSGFDFWHFDMFTYNNRYYCVVTPEIANEILLGESDDGVNYRFWDTPLLSTKHSGATYMYKPTAMVLDGEFYLWYPADEKKSDRKTTRIWMTTMQFDSLLYMLRKRQP
jgi:hypothetical protein